MTLPVTRGDRLAVGQPSRPADPAALAALILAGFDRHYGLFRYCAQRAKTLFEAGDWHGIQRLARDRIAYYDTRVRECQGEIERSLGGQGGAQAQPAAFWQAVRREYVTLLAEHRQPECAETFFNSVSTHLLHRDYFNNDFLFARPAVATEHLDSEQPSWRSYYPLRNGLHRSLLQAVADLGLACPFDDLPRDLRWVLRDAVARLRESRQGRRDGFDIESDCQIQVLRTLFFRNKGAYLIGRFINNHQSWPFAIPILRNAAGRLYLDALLFSADEISTLFSFTRAYFLVDMETPAAYVGFLSSLLPDKPKAELYTMIGLHKQGKTLFYRDFLHHLRHSSDEFVLAPGIKGMVMSVFTLPSYPYVFKIIKDRIAKDGMDRATVMRKYQLVKLHDRIGRMADTWEYSEVVLPRQRFSAELIAELQLQAPSIIEVSEHTVRLRHVYIERRMTPLNLYLQHGTPAQLEHGVREYGQAIRELAAANIFPGDMLFKNFGVTRLGRVVFYDYDEIQYMTEMNFRIIPPAPNEEAELSSEPWYAIGPNDVFPEELGRFLLGDARVRRVFMQHHAELLEAGFWSRCQAGVRRGRLEDLYPYDPARRFINRHSSTSTRSIS